jgi:hypothetical protein
LTIDWGPAPVVGYSTICARTADAAPRKRATASARRAVREGNG